MPELRTTSLIQTLVRRRESVSCAESLTGGQLASELIGPTGASEVMLGGIVAYATSAKEELLKVDSETIAAHGTVSRQTALAMAAGARQAFGSTWALATTGVAGPGSHEGHPAGTVFVALVGQPAGGGVELVKKHHLSGNRDEVRRMATQVAIELLAEGLESDAGTNWGPDALI